MNMHRRSHEDTWTAVFFYITILVSAALIAIPTLRPLSASKLAILLMTVGMVVVFVRRESKRRTLGLTIQQHYLVKKIKHDPLQVWQMKDSHVGLAFIHRR